MKDFLFDLKNVYKIPILNIHEWNLIHFVLHVIYILPCLKKLIRLHMLDAVTMPDSNVPCLAHIGL